MATQELVTLIGGSVGGTVALGTLVLAGLEYLRAGRTNRAKLFFELRERLKAYPLGRIAELIDVAKRPDDAGARAQAELRNLTLKDKRDYLSLFEEVSLMMEWRLVKPEVAHYTFGYYAILCWECESFWGDNINKWTPYRARFQRVYAAMKKQSEREMASAKIRGRAHGGTQPAVGR